MADSSHCVDSTLRPTQFSKGGRTFVMFGLVAIGFGREFSPTRSRVIDQTLSSLGSAQTSS